MGLSSKETVELEKAMDRIWEVARSFGLDPFPIHFEVVPSSIMYEFGAYGLPGRFSHWTHGKAYYQLKTMHDYGLNKILELVINTNPAYAFLMEGNSLLQNKLVVAHVIGHCDFFRHNVYFGQTNRQMAESASVNAERIRHYEFEHSPAEVEQFLDWVLSIAEHVDSNLFRRKKRPDRGSLVKPKKKERSTPYDDLLDLDRPAKEEPKAPSKRIPEEPESDLLEFLMKHAPDLEDWQRDILGIVREEALYFSPQGGTKIMNEGWASFWHRLILRELDLDDGEYVEFSELDSRVCSPSKSSLNPYCVGRAIFEDIERRWDQPTLEDQERFGRKGGEGRQKIFEVRELESDVSFIRNYLTKQLVEDLDLYLYRQEGRETKIVEKDWEKIRQAIVSSLVSHGRPSILVEDGDYRGRQGLYLRHVHEGIDLDLDYAERTLRHIYNIWGRSVYLETVVRGKKTLLKCDRKGNTTELIN
jgi:stage V sporulation protein R